MLLSSPLMVCDNVMSSPACFIKKKNLNTLLGWHTNPQELLLGINQAKITTENAGLVPITLF